MEDAQNWIEAISEFREGFVKMLSLTGGEPFYNPEKLAEISSFAEKKGLVVGAATNAFWADTRESAVRTLCEIPSLRLLALSTDVYHQESIPFEYIENAISAAEECGLLCYINVCTDSLESPQYISIVRNLQELVGDEAIITAITVPVGRAAERAGRSKYKITAEPPSSACSAACSPVIFPDGRVLACVGPVVDIKSHHPLVLGNLRERPLKEILHNAEMNSILHAIRIWGPGKLISMMKEAGLDECLPDNYLENCVCSPCYGMMSQPEVLVFLSELAKDPDFKRKVAYARLYYLEEPEMIETVSIRH